MFLGMQAVGCVTTVMKEDISCRFFVVALVVTT